jgi:hypothetical protein
MRALGLALLFAIVACSSTPPPDESVHRTYQQAEIGVYTGGWPDDAAGTPDATAGEGPEAGATGGDAAGVDGAADATACHCPRRSTLCGRLLATSSYCGGAAPPYELLAELATPRPQASRLVVVRTGDANRYGAPALDQQRTDENGCFAFRLEPGTYCLVEETKRQWEGRADEAAAGADPECVRSWLATCDGTFVVAEEPVRDAVVQVGRGCSENPCLPAPAYP